MKQPTSGPPLAYGIQSESGDCGLYCSLCQEERDEPHTWEECARYLAPRAADLQGAECERQQLAEVLALVVHVLDSDESAVVRVDWIREVIDFHAPRLPVLQPSAIARALEMSDEHAGRVGLDED